MVVFTCTHCGDSLQKPKVDKHYQTVCRTTKSLTCVDCLKDFRGEEYTAHTKCVTEEERYAAKGTNANSIKKGEVKQEHWTELIKNVVSTAGNVPNDQKRVLDVVANSVNVPRKKNKFINFIKSSTGGRIKDEKIEVVWNMIEQYQSTQNNCNNEELQISKDVNKNDQPVENKKKRKSKEIQESLVTAETVEPPKAKKRKDKEIQEPIAVTESVSLYKYKTKEMQEPNVAETTADATEIKQKKKKHKSNNIDENNQVDDATDIKIHKEKRKSKNVSETNEVDNKVDDVEESTDNIPKKKRKSKHKLEQAVNGAGVDLQIEHKKRKMDQITALEGNELLEDNAEPKTHEASVNNSTSSDFSFEQQILKVLTAKNGVTLEKLQKKVLTVYSKKTGNEASKKAIKKFKRKLKKMTDVQIKENNVSIISNT